jgi:hypothetical protein
LRIWAEFSFFGVQHYDKILITLEGLHLGGNFEVNIFFGEGCMTRMQ